MKTLIIIVVLNTFLISQTEHTFKLGTGIKYNYHNTLISSFKDNYSCCGEFSSIQEFNNNFSIYYGLSVLDRLDIYSSISYNLFNGSFNNYRFELINVNGINENGKIGYFLDYEFNLLNWITGIEYEITRNLYFNTGIGFGFINDFQLNGYEQIVVPADRGTFKINDTTFSRRRNIFIYNSEISSIFNLNFSISYALPLTKEYTSELRPNLSFNYFPGNFTKNDKWTVLQVGAGLDLVYYFNRKNPDNYFAKDIVIDNDLFVTAFTLSKKERLIPELKFFQEVYETITISSKIESVTKDTIYNSNFPGLRFRYDYSLINNPIAEKLFINFQNENLVVDLKGYPKKYNFRFKTDSIKNFKKQINYFIEIENSKKIFRSKEVNQSINLEQKKYKKYVIENINNVSFDLIKITNKNKVILLYSNDITMGDFFKISKFEKSKFRLQQDYNLDKFSIILIKEL